ncbi:hypothetical protein [Pseudorhizobium flavum]|uniref:hypothetical protein n=1 Tax=Pseudorhizobium flavum TaxID=1335061 RepID=UPI0011155A6B|nr:hypothetical protein [Pseudorhizobium flavum]
MTAPVVQTLDAQASLVADLNAHLQHDGFQYYVDKLLLTEDMLPIQRHYAASLIEAFLVHHVLDLAFEADQLAKKQPAHAEGGSEVC